MIHLLIVDEIQLNCDALAVVLERETDFAIVGKANTVEHALAQIADQGCHLALVSTNLADGGAITLIEQLKVDFPTIRTLVLGVADTKAIIVRYIEAGAIGYLLRQEPFEMLLDKIRAAVEQRALVTPEIAAILIERVSALSDQLVDLGIEHADYDKLTTREKEILGLVADGLTNQEIAEELVIEIGTVKNHVHNILEKLNVHSRQDAAIYLSLVERDDA